jgi:pimeloyl-ACP methyl ester carboxylesterase
LQVEDIEGIGLARSTRARHGTRGHFRGPALGIYGHLERRSFTWRPEGQPGVSVPRASASGLNRLRPSKRFDYPGFWLSERPDGYGYRPDEHARVIGEFVDPLDLDGFLIMMQDWGGPIGLSIALERAERVRGLVLGNTWFWPLQDLITKFFSKTMATGFMQWQMLEKSFFVERLMPNVMSTKLTEAEMDHCRYAQPSPERR